MLLADSDHVNWVLIVVLVALALLLAMVSSTASGAWLADVPGDSPTSQTGLLLPAASQQTRGARTPAETWYIARELYRAGEYVRAAKAFETVVEAYPCDAGATIWAGMAAYRAGDHRGAIRYWEAACDAVASESNVWPAVALTAAHLKAGRVHDAAKRILPLAESSETAGSRTAGNPIVSFHMALVYEQLAKAAPSYRDAFDESLALRFSPPLASSDAGFVVSPNSRSWLIFLTKQALKRTIGAARSLEWAAPVVPESATVEPSLAPTVEDLLFAIDSADFAAKAHGKLRALQLYESPPNRKIEIFDDRDAIKRGHFIA